LLPRGCVVSGMGNFSYWIEKLQEHYLRKTGMRFYPGTLNVRPYGGTVSVNMVPCFIRIPGHSEAKAAFLLRTDANEEERGHHPKTIVEIATDVRLRDAFELKDGDGVEIEVVP
jgi:riboflavin kinase, archaea type